MIISNEYGFSFVHIPKNAGTTLRSVLLRFNDQAGGFNRISDHPVLGRIHGQHIPLDVLREHFPEAYLALRNTYTYAVYRDPFDRFASSVNHTLRRDKRVDQITDDVLIEECLKVSRDLEALGDDHPPFERTLLSRQHVYVFDGVDRIVDELVPITSVTSIVNDISRRVGEPLAIQHSENKSVRFKQKGLSRPIMKASRLSKKLLPRQVHRALRRKAINRLTERDNRTKEIVRSHDRISSFVADYYSRDFELAELVSAPERAAG